MAEHDVAPRRTSLGDSELPLTDPHIVLALGSMARLYSEPKDKDMLMLFRCTLHAMAFIQKMIENINSFSTYSNADTRKLIFMRDIMMFSYGYLLKPHNSQDILHCEYIEARRLIDFISSAPQPPFDGVMAHIHNMIQ